MQVATNSLVFLTKMILDYNIPFPCHPDEGGILGCSSKLDFALVRQFKTLRSLLRRDDRKNKSQSDRTRVVQIQRIFTN